MNASADVAHSRSLSWVAVSRPVWYHQINRIHMCACLIIWILISFCKKTQVSDPHRRIDFTFASISFWLPWLCASWFKHWFYFNWSSKTGHSFFCRTWSWCHSLLWWHRDEVDWSWWGCTATADATVVAACRQWSQNLLLLLLLWQSQVLLLHSFQALHELLKPPSAGRKFQKLN